MTWLKDNPIGMALAGTGGFLLLLALIFAWAWTRPVTSAGIFSDAATRIAAMPVRGDSQLGPQDDYAVINERPIFEESRTPPAIVDTDAGQAVEEQTTIADAPEVRLTGVVITPDQRIVTFTPNSGGESMVISQGIPLDGEYVGWEVSEVNPRTVVLTSLEGDELTLDLEVNKSVIKEPPKPVSKPASQPDETAPSRAQPPAVADSDEQPLTRAEQIRQRIQQRREELRRGSSSPGNSSPGSSSAPTKEDKNTTSGRMNYQDALNAMMQSGSDGSNNRDSGDNRDDRDDN
jgi:type II secretory pathway component PulC